MENDLFLDKEKFWEIIDLKFLDRKVLDDVINFFIFSAKDFVNQCNENEIFKIT